MLKNHILSLRDVREKQRCRRRTGVIRRETDTIALRSQKAPVAQAAGGVIEIRHDLTGGAVAFVAPGIVQLIGNAVQQTADGFMILTGDLGLLLPEVPVAVALSILNVQKFVGRDGDKIGLYIFRGFDHADFTETEQVAVKGIDLRPQNDGTGVAAVIAGCHAVNLLKGAGKGFV